MLNRRRVVQGGLVTVGSLSVSTPFGARAEGKPPVKIRAGESYQIPEGTIHDAKAGDKPFKVLGVYVAKPAP